MKKQQLEVELKAAQDKVAVLKAKLAGRDGSRPAGLDASIPGSCFASLFETMGQGVVYQDREGAIIQANPAAERILGVSFEQMQGRQSVDPCWRAIREDGSAFPGEQHPAMAALRTGRPVNDVVMGVFHPDLEDYRWILICAIPEFLPDDSQPYQVHSTFTDITERRKTEEALRQSEAQYRTLVNALDISLCRWLPDTSLVFANDKYCQLFGVDENCVGQKWLDFLPEEARQSTAEYYQELTQHPETVYYEHPVTLKDGSVRYYQWIDTPTLNPDGELEHFQSVGLDITDRKLMENTLRDSEELHRLTLGNISDAVFITDDLGTLTFICPNVRTIFGYSQAEVAELGNISRLLGGGTDHRDRLFDLEDLEKAGEIADIEWMAVDKAGQQHNLLVNIKRILIQNGTLLYTCHDITERKQAEELTEAQRDLARIISESITGQEAWKRCLELVLNISGMDCGGIYLFRDDYHSVESVYRLGIGEELSLAINRFMQARISNLPQTDLLLWSGRPVYLVNEEIGRIGFPQDERISVAAVVPIHYQGRLLGGMNLGSHHLESIPPFKRVVIETLADEIGSFTAFLETEARLRQSEKRYRLISENSADVIWTMDPFLGRFTYVSPAVFNLRGLSPEEVMAEPVQASMTPDAYRKVSALLPGRLAAFANGDLSARIRADEVDQICKDGSLVPTEVVTTLLTNADGQVVEILGVSRDIHQRKKAEEALRESEERFRSLFETSNAVMLVIEPDSGAILNANSAAVEFYGYPYEQLTSMRIQEINQLPPNEVAAERQKAKREERNYFIFPHRLADGRMRTVEVRSHPIKVQGQTLLYSIVYDITTRMQTEKQLKAEQEKLSQVAATVPGLICSFRQSPEGLFSMPYTSPMIREVYGIDSSEVAEDAAPILSRIHPDDLWYVSESIAASGLKLTPWHVKYRYLHPTKGIVWLEGRSVPSREPDGSVIWYGFIADITEQKRTEEALQDSQMRSELAVQGANAGLWDWNLRSGELFTNDRWAEMLGYTRQELEPSTIHTWEQLCQPDDLKNNLRQIDRYLAGESGSYEIETRMRHKNAGWVWVLTSGRATEWDAARKPIRMSGVHIDITARKQAEALVVTQRDLASSFNRFSGGKPDWEFSLEAALQVSGMDAGGIYLFDDSGRFLELVSHQGLGADFVQAIGRFPVEAREVQTLLQGEIVCIEAERLEQEEVYLAEGLRSLVVIPIGYQGQVVGCLNVASHELGQIPQAAVEALGLIGLEIGNFIVHWRAEMSLRKSEERYRGLLQSLDSVIVTVDYDGRLLYMNDVAARQLGGAPQDFISKMMYEAFPQPVADLQLGYVQQTIREDSGLVTESQSMVQGELRWYRTSVQPIHDQDGRAVHALVNATDIHELKTMQHKLLELNSTLEKRVQERTAEVQDLYNNAPCGYQSLDCEGNIMMINQTELDWLGYTQAELIGMPFIRLLNRESQGVFQVHFPDFKRRGWLKDLELDLIRKNGTSFPILVNATAVYKPDGSYLMSRSTLLDNSERKKAEQALRQSEQTYRALFDNSNDGIFLMSPERVELMANRKALELVEYSEEEYRQLNNEYIVQQAEQDDAVANFAAVLRGETVPLYERTLVTKSGAEVPVEINLSAIRDTDGKIFMVQSVVRDITLRKQAEKNLRESEEQNRLLFEESPDAIALLDSAGAIQRVNRAFEQLAALPRQRIIGQKADQIGLMTSQMSDHLVMAVNQAVSRQDNFVNVEYQITDVDGSARDIESRIFILKLGGVDHLLVTSRDISIHKKAQETLRRANVELERALRMKDEFMANMSHELRTPLNAILGISESLEEQLIGPLNEKQMKYIQTVSESGRHLLALINDILDLSKIEAGRMTLSIQSVPVEQIIQSSLRMVKELTHKKNLQVSSVLDSRVRVVEVDERRIKQVLVNLLGNAVKFTPENGKIGVEVSGDPQARQVVITVWDTGIGIEAEDKPRLFQPFVQLDSGLGRARSGTGLGLALVAQIMRLHGGRVDVQSQVGEGSRFSIYFPWNEQNLGERPKRSRGDAPTKPLAQVAQANRGKILLVEDTESVILLTGDYLQALGYQVLVARDGLSGIAEAKSSRPDLILMDIQMPGMDGFTATRLMREDPLLKEIPIIALTAMAMAGDREICLEAGMQDYLSKPISLKELARVVHHYMQIGRRKDK